MNQIVEKSLENAESQAQRVLAAAKRIVDNQFVPGYALKHPGIVSNVVSTQNILLQAELQKQFV